MLCQPLGGVILVLGLAIRHEMHTEDTHSQDAPRNAAIEKQWDHNAHGSIHSVPYPLLEQVRLRFLASSGSPCRWQGQSPKGFGMI